jgi:Na+/melibiose symporter-like transporter
MMMGMASLRRWLAVLAVTVVAGVLMPAVAWAGGSPEVLAVAGEAARARRAFGGVFLLFAALCCLGVVALVILTVVLIARGRRTGPR